MPKRVLIPFRFFEKVQPYVEAVKAAGLEAIPADVSQPISLDPADGLLLTGGTDVNPARYHQTPHAKTNSSDDDRDEIELELIDRALSSDLPVLAICRGLQLLNVFHGGTLIQHLDSHPRHAPETPDKGASVHEIQIAPGSLLAEIAGSARWKVNSRHHQAVGRVGEALEVTAHGADDGVIEALERRDRSFVLAVQWHPEDQARHDPEQRKLFERFTSALEA